MFSTPTSLKLEKPILDIFVGIGILSLKGYALKSSVASKRSRNGLDAKFAPALD